MGFFDRLAGKPASSTPEGGNGTPSNFDPSVSGVAPRLIAAREKLDAKDLKGALAIYEELLATSGDRADVLVTISGDLGSTGHIPEIIELVAPRYDATRHGPAAGINLIQAYLAVRDADAARHVLDILFALQKPELEGRLHGFSNAIAELVNHGDVLAVPEFMPASGEGGGSPPPPTVGLALVTISKPDLVLRPGVVRRHPPEEGGEAPARRLRPARPSRRLRGRRRRHERRPRTRWGGFRARSPSGSPRRSTSRRSIPPSPRSAACTTATARAGPRSSRRTGRSTA